MALRDYVSSYDKYLVNYLRFREDIGLEIQKKLAKINLAKDTATIDYPATPFKKENLNLDSLSRLNQLRDFTNGKMEGSIRTERTMSRQLTASVSVSLLSN